MIKAIITGATGMVGEGVLHECLHHPDIAEVLVINRRSCGYSHPKLREILHQDFFELSPLKTRIAEYNACFFCLGVSSVGMNESEYFRLTHTLTVGFARIMAETCSSLTFCYISGSGTDSSEKGRVMWARVKGKTENDLMKLPIDHVFAFLPGYIQPIRGLKNTLGFYKYFNWLYPALRLAFPKYVCTLEQIGQAMIHAAIRGYPKKVLEVRDIVQLSMP